MLFRSINKAVAQINFCVVPLHGIIWANLTAAIVTSEFDGNGLGLRGKEYDGWHICNGNGGTPDLSGKPIIANVTGAGGTVGTHDETDNDEFYELVPLMRLARGEA